MSCEEGEFVVQKHWRATQERVEKFLSPTVFTDVNLRGRLYSAHAPLTKIKWASAGKDRLPFEGAKQLLHRKGVDITESISGFKISPIWSTHWFECSVSLPKEWAGNHVRFRWDSSSEAMGLTGSSDSRQLRTDYILTRSASGGEIFTLYVEAAANGMFGAGRGGLINPPDPTREFPLVMAEVAVFDQDVYDLIMDLTVLYDMSKHMPSESPRAYEALYTANKVVNVCNPFDKSTFAQCREIAAKFLSEVNGDSQQTIHAIGHCHIDSAWLWPYSETRRKCGRSWSSTLQLMEDYPDFTFVCSQAQQLEWVKQDYPTLYQRLKKMASAGRFLPAGGTWIEMDGNIPSGESFVRQFLIGQRFFKKEFGSYCKEFWLPDTFGYSAQLPQIIKGAGIKYFLTQKLSWSLTNKFPHNSFIWEGLDGSQILTHFPPADTYESTANVADLLKTVTRMKDKGRTRHSVLLYGHGDGGGGPTEDMLEFLKRMENVDGLPKVKHSSPQQFFSTLESQDQPNLCKWVGELYLELHRGTYTSQAKIKLENRRIEFLLHELDFIGAVNYMVDAYRDKLDTLPTAVLPIWKKFLLNQFHDVIPGSCIEQVAIDALEIYSEVKAKIQKLFNALFHAFTSKSYLKSSERSYIIINSFSWERTEVLALQDERSDEEDLSSKAKRQKMDSDSTTECGIEQTLKDGTQLRFVTCLPMSIGCLVDAKPSATVSLVKNGEVYVLENSVLKATVTKNGLLKSLFHKETQTEAIETSRGYGNQFVLFDDVPLFWDAWDVMEYHLETRTAVTLDGKQEASIEEAGPLRAILKFSLCISPLSHIIQQIILDAQSPYLQFKTMVSWHERHKFLKVEFPLNVRAHEAKYEIQFGHISRPTHFNTTWDQARFEVCGHKWADLSEHAFGVALLNDCKYGYSTLDNIMRLSLLRAPKAPDENCDMGDHSFSYAIMPHKGTLQESGVIQQAYNFNHPLSAIQSYHHGQPKSFLQIDNPAVVIETVKLFEEVSKGSGFVVRLYEAYGSHAEAALSGPSIASYQRCNLLEEAEGLAQDGSVIHLNLKPFEIVTFLIFTKN